MMRISPMRMAGRPAARLPRQASLLAFLRRVRYAVAALSFVALAGYVLQPVTCSARPANIRAAAALAQPAAPDGSQSAVLASTDGPGHVRPACCAAYDVATARIVRNAAFVLPAGLSPLALAVAPAWPSRNSTFPGQVPRSQVVGNAVPYHSRSTRRLF